MTEENQPPQNPYPGAAPGPQQPYPQAPQPGWGVPPGQQMPVFPVYVRPDLPKATAAMVVGIISVAGAFACVLPILAAPVAWVLGASARKEIRQNPQQWGGEGKATAGMVLGIIGSVLLLLAIVAVVVLIAVAVSDPNFSGDSNTGV